MLIFFFDSDTSRRGGPRQQRDQEGLGTFLQRKYQKKPKKCFAIAIITNIEHYFKEKTRKPKKKLKNCYAIEILTEIEHFYYEQKFKKYFAVEIITNILQKLKI